MIAVAGSVYQVWDLEPIYPADGSDAIRLRVEILRIGKHVFKARLWRFEFYRIQPTFPQHERKPRIRYADEVIAVMDDGINDIDNLTASTPEALFNLVLNKIADEFNLSRVSHKGQASRPRGRQHSNMKGRK